MGMSVCPSVRPCVCVSVCHRFLRFLRRAYGLRTPSDPLRKTSTLVCQITSEILSTYATSYVQILWSLFLLKNTFYQKNTLIYQVQKLAKITKIGAHWQCDFDRYCSKSTLFELRHTSHNVWRVNYFVAVSATKLRATRPAGCCLVFVSQYDIFRFCLR